MGQDITNRSYQREKSIIFFQDTLQLDSLSIIPASISVLDFNEEPLLENLYKIDAINAKIWRLTDSLKTLQIKYRVFPNKLNAEEYASSIRKERIGKDSLDYITYTDLTKERDLFEFDNLRIEGGVGRALSFGNSQNLVVNSNLNLRLSGELENGVQIVGALTDENVPFQPEGNSRQIRELDQVFLQFKKDEHQVTLGDYEQRNPSSYFLKYNKRLQGVNYSGKFKFNNDWESKTSVSGAVSRGKYARNTFQGNEGNQGPYKLFGANNESFIIILAGTEQVYIDGQKLERGRDRDYIIDYNIGEIIFTARRLITNRTRIAVEFEYTDQTYSRTFLHTEADYGNEKLNLRVNFYTEQDNKGDANLIDTTLNAGSFLTGAGDNFENFFLPGEKLENYDNTRIQYRKTDTLVLGTTYTGVFAYSQVAGAERYKVIYTFVGEGNGDYVVESQLLNGRVYKWVTPELDGKQGSYVAAINLVPPAKQQMLSLTTSYAINKENNLQLETAYSNKDLNTFSPQGNNDNSGLALRLKWTGKHYIGQDSTKNYLTTSANVEWKQRQFRPIERYRPVEFTRDWSIQNLQADSLNEQLSNVQVAYYLSAATRLQYNFANYNLENGYNGLNNKLSLYHQNQDWNISGIAEMLTAKGTVSKNKLLRPRFDIARKFKSLKGFQIGVNGDVEVRENRIAGSNLLDFNSIRNDTYSAFIRTADTAKISFKLSAGKRWDYSPVAENLEQVFSTNFLQTEGSINKFKKHKLSYIFTLRDLTVTNQLITEEQNKRSMLGKLNYSGNLLKGVLKTGFNYEIGSGREPKREFSYVPVADGEGVYVWNDYNNNGLQEISEFEVANFQDEANFIRFFTTTNEYINADVNRLNQWMEWNPQLLWRNKEGMKGFVSKFSMITNLTVDRKLFETANTSLLNPYAFNLDNSDLVSSNVRLNNSLLFNKLSNKFRMAYRYRTNENKSQLLAGFEQRELQQHLITNDLFFKNKMSLQTTFSKTNQSFFAENYSNKNFSFDRYSVSPRLNWVVNNRIRLGAKYNFTKSNNLPQFGGEKATSNALDTNLTYSKANLFSLLGGFQLTNIGYNGDNNSPVTFTMLNGLQEGKNLQWRINLEREVAKSVRISLSYDGRQLGDKDPVHTGRARVSALF